MVATGGAKTFIAPPADYRRRPKAEARRSRAQERAVVGDTPNLAARPLGLSKPIIFTMWKVGLLSKAPQQFELQKSRLYLHFPQCGNAENGGKGLDPYAVSW
jgi:hypothetical protein